LTISLQPLMTLTNVKTQKNSDLTRCFLIVIIVDF
jgi:hypothetical protein